MRMLRVAVLVARDIFIEIPAVGRRGGPLPGGFSSSAPMRPASRFGIPQLDHRSGLI